MVFAEWGLEVMKVVKQRKDASRRDIFVFKSHREVNSVTKKLVKFMSNLTLKIYSLFANHVFQL